MTLYNEILQKMRKDAQYSQENMADLMSMDSSTYNRLENGKIKLKMEHIPKIAKAINKSEDEILNQFRGCTFNNSINNSAKNSQNVVINILEKELLQQLLAEKELSLTTKDEVIKLQSITIVLLQAEIDRLKIGN